MPRVLGWSYGGVLWGGRFLMSQVPRKGIRAEALSSPRRQGYEPIIPTGDGCPDLSAAQPLQAHNLRELPIPYPLSGEAVKSHRQEILGRS
eukprot:CAMPEP_0180358376 /NCGR_PEP_ID=MMETSP0989-20121125/10514_1 /TAXON_ID=697907 /ORGANISM="non described non described, Strain CCMP2293" /LENGTH=90 /DNA_ID=CAMNT_0022348851 /DNA_START=192 /DNA_END=465 /DNA_ORIENTATION=-